MIAGDGISYEIIADFDLKHCSASSFGIALRCSKTKETLIECDISSVELIFNSTRSGKWEGGRRRCLLESVRKDSIQLHIFVDTSLIKIFTDDGRTVMTCNIYPSSESKGTYIYSDNGDVILKNFNVWGLSTI